MNAWVALVCSSEGLRPVIVAGRNRFEALRAVAELVGPGCHVLKLKRSVALDRRG